MYLPSDDNVWVAKKDTKRSSVLLLCLVSFFATQTLNKIFVKIYKYVYLNRWQEINLGGHSQTTFTRFVFFLTTYPPPFTFSMV